jgi:hypothetical protein
MLPYVLELPVLSGDPEGAIPGGAGGAVTQPFEHWEVAEKHFREMSAKWVTPAIVYATEMVSRPYNSVLQTSQILTLRRQLEQVNKLYTGPLSRGDEEMLAAADALFRSTMNLLDKLDE